MELGSDAADYEHHELDDTHGYSGLTPEGHDIMPDTEILRDQRQHDEEPTSDDAVGSFDKASEAPPAQEAAQDPATHETPNAAAETAAAPDASAKDPNVTPPPQRVAYGPRATVHSEQSLARNARPMPFEEAAAMARATRDRVDIADLRDFGGVFDRDIEYVRTALQSPDIYQFRLYTRPPERPELRIPNVCGMYFGSHYEKTRAETQGKMHDAGVRLFRTEDRTPEDHAQAGRAVLQGIATQVRNTQAIMESPIKPPFTNALGGAAKMALLTSLRLLNSRPEKPPELAEWLCNNIPRFAWDGLSLPDEVPVPDDYQPRLHQLWSGYTPKEASYLISPDKLAEGKAPYHMAMQAADTVAAEGHPDAAYRIKTSVIMQTIDTELSRFQEPDDDGKIEIPFFNILAGPAMVGDISAQKGAHYDYAKNIRATVKETWNRIGQEAKDGTSGPAIAFINKLMHDPGNEGSENAAPYLARSLLEQARTSTVDVVDTLRGLEHAGMPWVSSIVEKIRTMPSRPILTNEEAAAFAATSLPGEVPVTPPEQLTESAGRLLNGDDFYTIKIPLSDIAGTQPGVTATVHADITTEGTVLATINYKQGGESQQVPMVIDLTTGAVQLHTMDDEPLDEATAARYRSIVAKAIVDEDSAHRADAEAEQAAAAAAASRVTPVARTPERQQPRQPVSQGPKIKTRGIAAEIEEPESEPDATEVPDGSQQGAYQVTLVGAGVDDIEKLLAAAKPPIKGVSHEQLAAKVDFLLMRSQQANTSFGKRAKVNALTPTKLRQVNLGERSRRIRLFFEEDDGGVLTLRGVFDKGRDDIGKEDTYTQTLAKRLATEKAAAQKAAARAAARNKRT